MCVLCIVSHLSFLFLSLLCLSFFMAFLCTQSHLQFGCHSELYEQVMIRLGSFSLTLRVVSFMISVDEGTTKLFPVFYRFC